MPAYRSYRYYRRSRRGYSRKTNVYKGELPKTTKAPPRSAFKLGTMVDSYKPTDAGYVFRSFVGSFDTTSVEYLTGFSAYVDVTVSALHPLALWVGIVDMDRASVREGWRDGLPLEIFGSGHAKGLHPVPDPTMARVAKSKSVTIRITDPSVSASGYVRLWVPIKSWIGLNRKGGKTPHTTFKLVIVQQSLREYVKSSIITTDINTKMYFRNT